MQGISVGARFDVSLCFAGLRATKVTTNYIYNNMAYLLLLRLAAGAELATSHQGRHLPPHRAFPSNGDYSICWDNPRARRNMGPVHASIGCSRYPYMPVCSFALIENMALLMYDFPPSEFILL